MGYNESSKAYRIYIPGSRHIEFSRDATFEEEMAVKKGRALDMEIDDEELDMRSSPSPIQNELAGKDEPIDPIDPSARVDIPEDMEKRRKDLDAHNRPYRMQRGMKPHTFLYEKAKDLKGSPVMQHR